MSGNPPTTARPGWTSPRAFRSARSTSSARTPWTGTSSTSARTRRVYVTTDGAKTWNVLGGNLPSVYVHDLIIHPRDNIIVIATHGRGMWALDANAVNNKDKRRDRFFGE